MINNLFRPGWRPSLTLVNRPGFDSARDTVMWLIATMFGHHKSQIERKI